MRQLAAITIVAGLTCLLSGQQSDSVYLSGAEPGENSAAERIEAKLDAIIRRLESIEERVSRLEQSEMRPIGLQYFERGGIIYDVDGRKAGIWGVNGLPTILPNAAR